MKASSKNSKNLGHVSDVQWWRKDEWPTTMVHTDNVSYVDWLKKEQVAGIWDLSKHVESNNWSRRGSG